MRVLKVLNLNLGILCIFSYLPSNRQVCLLSVRWFWKNLPLFSFQQVAVDDAEVFAIFMFFKILGCDLSVDKTWIVMQCSSSLESHGLINMALTRRNLNMAAIFNKA